MSKFNEKSAGFRMYVEFNKATFCLYGEFDEGNFLRTAGARSNKVPFVKFYTFLRDQSKVTFSATFSMYVEINIKVTFWGLFFRIQRVLTFELSKIQKI